MFYLVKQIDNAVPSLSQIKNFTLPSLNLPGKVSLTVCFSVYMYLLCAYPSVVLYSEPCHVLREPAVYNIESVHGEPCS